MFTNIVKLQPASCEYSCMNVLPNLYQGVTLRSRIEYLWKCKRCMHLCMFHKLWNNLISFVREDKHLMSRNKVSSADFPLNTKHIKSKTVLLILLVSTECTVSSGNDSWHFSWTRSLMTEIVFLQWMFHSECSYEGVKKMRYILFPLSDVEIRSEKL